MKKGKFVLLICGLLAFASCGKKDEGSTQLIAGTDSKTWKASKEINSQGDKEKLSKEEKNDELKICQRWS